MKAFTIALALLAAPLAHAGEKPGALTVSQPWSRPAQAGMNGVGFFTVANAGKTPVILKRVESAAAAKVEMHQSSMAGGVMSMRRRDDGIVVPAGGQVAFAPGGYHLMLLGLKRTQGPGQKLSVTLVFDNGRKIPVDLPVQLVPPKAHGALEGMH
jgi:copper(I)-binding protein